MKTYRNQQRAGLQRRTRLKRGKGIPWRSPKREKVYAGNGEKIVCPFCDETLDDGRRNFVAHVVSEHRACMIQGVGCTAVTQSVHESIRGADRAMVPGALADSTGQTFFAACFSCNQLCASPRAPVRAWLKARGFIQSRVARRVRA